MAMRNVAMAAGIEIAAHVGTETHASSILRAWLPGNDWPAGIQKQAPVLWQWYMQLTHVEEAFKTLKTDLHLRPIHHQLQRCVEAHILVAFLGYCLHATLRRKLQPHAPGLIASRAGPRLPV